MIDNGIAVVPTSRLACTNKGAGSFAARLGWHVEEEEGEEEEKEEEEEEEDKEEEEKEEEEEEEEEEEAGQDLNDRGRKEHRHSTNTNDGQTDRKGRKTRTVQAFFQPSPTSQCKQRPHIHMF